MGKSSFKMKQLPLMAVVGTVMLFVVYRTLKYENYQEEIEKKENIWGHDGQDELEYHSTSAELKGLPRGIIHDTSNFELRPLWLPRSSRSKNVMGTPAVIDVASPDDC